MKRNLLLLLAIAIGVAISVARHRPAEIAGGAAPAAGNGESASVADDGSLQRAIAARADGVPVSGRGVVLKLLPDDREGSPHQRILLRLAEGGTLLIAHNLALAPRVSPLAPGDTLEFAGDYAWNEKGGVVHWTHADPGGRHRAGWIRRVAP